MSDTQLASLFVRFEEIRDDGPANGLLRHFVYLENPEKSLALRSDKRSARALLRKLEEDPYEYGYSRTGRILASRGVKVLPQLLEALAGSEGYYRVCLVNILSGISDPRRDAAFIAHLERYLAEEDKGFLGHPTVQPAMRVLASRKVDAAVPVLERFLSADDIEAEVRAEARIALGRMGVLDLGSIPAVPYESHAVTQIDTVRPQIELFEMLLKYGLLVTPLQLAEIESGDDMVVLHGTLNSGTWSLRFGAEKAGHVPFYYAWHTGPLSAAGYKGVAGREGAQWIVLYWAMDWIS